MSVILPTTTIDLPCYKQPDGVEGLSKKRIAALRQAASRRKRLLIFLASAVALVAAGAWVLNRPPAPAELSQARLQQLHRRGPANAHVTITEFGDFNCPSCQAYYRAGILERILEAYPGQVAVAFRHFPVITAASPDLAEAAECAADQGSFWRFHDRAFESAPLRRAEAKSLASELGLDREQFDACLDSGQYAPLVEAQTRQAFEIGFRGTPSFTINGRPLAGPPSFEGLVALIEAELDQDQ